MFDALEMSLKVLERLAHVETRIRRKSASLAKQLADASESVALNLGEGQSQPPSGRRPIRGRRPSDQNCSRRPASVRCRALLGRNELLQARSWGLLIRGCSIWRPIHPNEPKTRRRSSRPSVHRTSYAKARRSRERIASASRRCGRSRRTLVRPARARESCRTDCRFDVSRWTGLPTASGS